MSSHGLVQHSQGGAGRPGDRWGGGGATSLFVTPPRGVLTGVNETSDTRPLQDKNGSALAYPGIVSAATEGCYFLPKMADCQIVGRWKLGGGKEPIKSPGRLSHGAILCQGGPVRRGVNERGPSIFPPCSFSNRRVVYTRRIDAPNAA